MVCSQAKVPDLDVVLRVKEDVDRLQVPVNHALKERRMAEEICSVTWLTFCCYHTKLFKCNP